MNLTPTQRANTKRLIAALRSGKYQRCEQYLRTEDGFCPWGIACDVIDPTRWSHSDLTENIFYYGGDPDDLESKEFFAPTEDVALAYGDLTRATFTSSDLHKVLPRFTADESKATGPWSIVELNDNFHLTLSETADVLEELFLTGNYLGGKPEEKEPYDYVADDFAFDAAREQRFK